MKNLRNFRKLVFFVLLFIFPFNIRYIFNFESIMTLECFREHLTLFLCPFDLGLLLLFSTFIWEKFSVFKKELTENKNIYLSFVFFVLILIISSFFSNNRNISFYNSFRIIEIIIFFFAIKNFLSKNSKTFFQSCYVVFIGGIFQSIIAILQFIKQKSIGLSLFGESLISPQILGVAKIEQNGEKIIRAYGTFPHPNILGTFLIITLACGIYILVENKRINFKEIFLLNKIGKIISQKKISSLKIVHIFLGLALILFGIIITFSRTVWFGCFVLIVFSFLKWIILNRHQFPIFNKAFFNEKTPEIKKEKTNEEKKITRDIFFLGTLYIIILSIFLSPLVYERICINNCRDKNNSYQIRQEYTATAINLIKDNSLWGVGPGNFVIEMKKYAVKNFKEWEKQPVHSLYLLIVSEIGIIGLIFLVYFIVQNISHFPFKKMFGILLLIFLFIGVFDHFFISTFQGQLLFWLCLAFFTSSCKIEARDKKELIF